jgi:hypothetical protein
LFSEPLEGRTTGEDIFVKRNEFFKTNKLSWNNCDGVYTDSTAAETGYKRGLLVQIKNSNNATDVIYMHSIIPWTNDFTEENELGLAVTKNIILSHLTT